MGSSYYGLAKNVYSTTSNFMDNNQNNQSEAQPNEEDTANTLKLYSGGYVTLPFDQEQFRDFVISLLGKPQTIEKRIYGRFEVNLQDIQNFHNLINQRLTQQNQALLSQFSVKIYYSDSSSITLNSYEDLVTYNEVRPLISVAVDLSWDYLIQFNDKQHPEKQSIDIRIWTAEASDLRRIRGKGEVLVIGSSESTSFFNITIRHTARTWGMDIESLLTSQVQSLIFPDKNLRKFIQAKSGWISLISGIVFFLGSVIGVFWATEIFVKNRLDRISTLLDAKEDISSRIFIIAQYLINGESSRHYLLVGIFLLLILIASIIVGIIIGSKANMEEPSFVILTNTAARNKQKKLKLMEAHWRNFIISIVVSLITNIAASYIFVYLTR